MPLALYRLLKNTFFTFSKTWRIHRYQFENIQNKIISNQSQFLEFVRSIETLEITKSLTSL